MQERRKLTCHVRGMFLILMSAMNTKKILNIVPQPSGPVGVSCRSLLNTAMAKVSGADAVVSSNSGWEVLDIVIAPKREWQSLYLGLDLRLCAKKESRNVIDQKTDFG